MASSPAVPVGGKPLTARDIIGFQADQAFRLGEVGFTTNFPKPEDIFKPHTLNTPIEDDTNNDAAVVTAMQATHNTLRQLHQRQVLMETNKSLLAHTETEVDRRILAAGKSKRYVAAQSLRKKVVDLMELKEPKLEPNFVTVWVKLDSMKVVKDMIQVNLPITVSIAEVFHLLDDIVESELANAGGKTVDNDAAPREKPGHWRYQLIGRNLSMVVNNASIRLETTGDYRRMIAVVTSGDRAPIAALARVGFMIVAPLLYFLTSLP